MDGLVKNSFVRHLILFFPAFIVILSIQIPFYEELSIEIGSYVAQSSDFENLAEYPSIPAETGVKTSIAHLFRIRVWRSGCHILLNHSNRF